MFSNLSNLLEPDSSLLSIFAYLMLHSLSWDSILAIASCNAATSKGTSLLWSIPCGLIEPSSLTASFSPQIASGTTGLTSCAKNPSTAFVESALKLNLYGLRSKV